MKSKILKFLTLAAAFCGMTAWGGDAITTQEALIEAVTAAENGATLELGVGTFTTYGTDVAKGKTLTFIGAGVETVWRYGKNANADGEGGSDYSFEGSNVTFKNLTLKDNYDSTSYYRGFVRAASMRFENVTFKNMIGYFGDKNSNGVYFKDCTFDVYSGSEYCVKAYGGADFVFDHCTFKANNKGYIQLYIQDGNETVHKATVLNCTFEAVSSTTKKTAVYVYDQGPTEGGIWEVRLEGENVQTGPGTQIANNSLSGDWLWGDVKYQTAAKTVIYENGVQVYGNGAKITPEKTADVVSAAVAVVDVTPADETTVVAANDKTVAANVMTASAEVIKAAESGLDALTSVDGQKYISIVLKSAKVAGDDPKVFKAMAFDVKPCKVSGSDSKVSVIPNSEITSPIKFRLPVDANATETKADVFHNGEKMGTYDVATESGVKFIEVSSAVFSEFSYQLVEAEVWPEGKTVKYGETYYETLKAAVEAAYDAKDDNIIIACKPGADVGAMTHVHVASDITVYGNGAYVSGGEHDFEVDTYKGKGGPSGSELTKDITLNINQLNGCAVWGQRLSDYKVTINLTGCKNVNRIYFSTAKGTIDINVTDCTFVKENGSSANTSIKTDSQGTWKIKGTTFNNIAVAIAATNENGPADVTVENCTFIDCATKENAAANSASDYASPIRVLGRAETTLKVDGCSFSYSADAERNSSDIIVGELRANKAANGVVTYEIVNTVGEIDVIETHDKNVTIADISTKTTVTEADKTKLVAGTNEAKAVLKPSTDDGFYHITKLDDLELFRDMVNGGETFSGKTVVLDASIDMTSVANWEPIGANGKQFKGTFDGNEKTISNLKVNANANYAGLFGSVFGATIQNLTLENPTVSNTATDYTAALVGGGYAKIGNCAVTGGSVKGVDQVGGVIGYLSCGYVKNCTVDSLKVEATDCRAGGITGKANVDSEYEISGNTVKGCEIVAAHTVSSLRSAAGLVGQVMAKANKEEADTQGNIKVSSYWSITDNTIQNTTTKTGDDTTFVPVGEFRSGNFQADTVTGEHIVRNSWSPRTTPNNYSMVNPGNSAEFVTILNANRHPCELGYNGEELPEGPDMSGTVINVTAANAQYVLDGAYGPIDGKTINFTESIDTALVLGRPTKYAGSNTEYRHGNFNNEGMSYDDFIAYKTQAGWTEYSYYTRSIENVKFTADKDVTLAGFTAHGGSHVYGTNAKPIYDYVRDNGTLCNDTNNGYYMVLTLSNIQFDGVSFTARVAFDTSSDRTVYDGINFKNCSFKTDNVSDAAGQAIRFYNETTSGNVKNLVVDGCTFKNCYQGVYSQKAVNITVTGSEFDTTGHNAIAIQNGSTFNHGDVVITDNVMKNIGDRAIRFNYVGDGTTITITGNTATYGGSNSEDCIKATSLADGVTTTVELNNWNNYGVAPNDPLKETVAKIGTKDYKSLEDATEAAQGSDVITVVGYTANMTAPADWKFSTTEGVTTLVRKSYVAQVGETKYETLAEAVAAATAGQTITLLKDLADTGNISLKAGVTLDGDGHKVTGNSAVYINKAGGTVQNVVFEDIHNDAGKLSAVYASGLEGTATIKDCTFDNCDWDAIQATPVAGAVLTITDNVFDTDNTDGVQQQRYVHIQSAANVDFTATVTGNVMKGDTNQGALEAYYFADEEKIDVSHNYIEDMADVCILDGTGALRNDTVFPAYKDAEKTELYQPVAMIATSAYSANYYPTLAAAAAAATDGKTITLISDVADAGNVSLKAGVTLDGDGHKVTGNSAVYINKAGGTVQNVVFEDIHNDAGKLSAVYASGLEGTATIKDCTFDNCDWDAIQATPVAGAVLTITDNVFDTDNTDGVQQQRYVHIQSAANVDFTATVTGNLMKGDTKQGALEAYYFADEEKIDVSHNYIEDMADVCILDGTGALRNDTVFPTYVDATKTELYTPAAMIATSAYSANYYATLAEAMAAVPADGTATTVTLLKDCSGNGIVVKAGQNVTVDFDQHKYTVNSDVLAGSNGTKNQAFQLLKGATVTFKDGAIVADNANVKMLIQNYADLTLENMTLDATEGTNSVKYVISNNAGNVAITGSTSITAKENGVAFDVFYWPSGSYVEGPKVTVDTTGTIAGAIEYGSDNSAGAAAAMGDKASLTLTAGTFTGPLTVYDCDEPAVTKGSAVVVTAPDGYKWTDDTTLVPCDYVAQIGDAKFESLADAVAAATAGQTVTLLANVDTTAQVEVADKAITLDLAGHTIAYTGAATLSSGVLLVHNGAGLTIDDSSTAKTGAIMSGENAYAAVAVTKKNDDASQPAVLTVNAGTLTGKYYGIAGNGTRHNTEITVNGGTIASTEGTGIYHPQEGTLTVTGGKVTGAENGIELRAGTLNVTGGVISSTSESFTVEGNGNGTSTVGAGIAVSQHTTKKPISVTVAGGTVSGQKSVVVANAQNATKDEFKVTVALNGGTFANGLEVSGDISGATVTKGATAEVAVPCAYKWDDTNTLVPNVNELTAVVDATASLQILVPEAVIHGKYEELNGETVTDQQNAYINEVEANGLKRWQNYVMGIDGSVAANTLSTAYVVGEGENITICTPIESFNVPADSGITVTYVLKRTTKPEDATSWTQFGDALATPAFPVDLSEQTGDTYWKIEAVFSGMPVQQ